MKVQPLSSKVWRNKFVKKLLFGLFVLFSLAAAGLAQTVEATKVDEFEFVDCDNLQNRLDYFFGRVINSLKPSKGYIMVYEGKVSSYKKDNEMVNPRRGEAKSQIQTIKNHTRFRSIASEKIVFVNGGLRNNFTVEFWLVPNDAAPPQATPTLKRIKYRKGRATDICRYL